MYLAITVLATITLYYELYVGGGADEDGSVLGAADRAVQGAASGLPFLQAHATAVQSAAAKTDGQWKAWYWICFGGVIFFLLSIPLLRGRWRTRDAKRDEAEVQELQTAG